MSANRFSDKIVARSRSRGRAGTGSKFWPLHAFYDPRPAGVPNE